MAHVGAQVTGCMDSSLPGHVQLNKTVTKYKS